MSALNFVSATPDVRFTYFRSPKTVVARFVAGRTRKAAVAGGLIFGFYTASKVIGFVKAYATPASRESFAKSFGNNTGMNALLGVPHNIETIPGYTNWNVMGIVVIIGGIWGLMLATKYFRGEEEAGRTELLLTGNTTARQAAKNTVLGMSANLALMYLIMAVLFTLIGKYKGVGYGTQSALFFALAAISSTVLFVAVGSFTSQLMPTRTRATILGAAIFGVSFLLRAVGDTTSQHWVLNVTPLGWIEKLLPLVNSQPIWLLPILGSAIVLFVLTIWITGRRDLGDSIVADKSSAAPRTGLLSSPFTVAIRLTRTVSIGWALAIAFMGFLYGSLTMSVLQSIANGPAKGKAFHKALSKLSHSSNISLATLFLGAIFLILMIAVMSYVASAVGKVRDEEAQGYVDNFLVQPVGRLQWLGGRILLVAFISMILCLVAGFGLWAGQATQHVGVPLHLLLEAGANIAAPVLFTLGACICALGFVPRLTSFVAYGVIGWSFLISLVASGTKLSHWILDTSVMHQTALAPAVNPNWTVNAWMIMLGLALCLAGMLRFNCRDLQSE
jgi:ABC-2 type transport system permease protein